MEKLVAVELRVVVTRIAAAERVSLSGNGELTGHGRGPRKTGRADPPLTGTQMPRVPLYTATVQAFVSTRLSQFVDL